MKYRWLKSKLVWVVVLLVALTLFPVAGCIIEDSPAPGCVKYSFGCSPAGGCFGKSIIEDLSVEPEIDCITIEVNNCNGGILEVSNACDEPFVLGGVEIAPHEHNVGLDVLGQENGVWLLTETATNFSDYIPAEDELIEILGTLGTQQVQVSYIKTKKLCE